VSLPGGEGVLTPGRILVVDDEDAVADVFRDYLVLMGGHEVETCSSGKDALAVFDAFAPEVVLTDLNLDRDMSGLDLMRAVKEKNPDVPVILVTGQVSIASAVAALREGAYDYITKPCDLEERGQLLGRALASRRLTETNRNLMRELTVANEILSRHELELRERIHVATWRMRTLFELSKDIARDLGFEFRSRVICEKARQITGAARSALFIAGDEDGQFRARAISGLDGEMPALAFAAGEGLNGVVAESQSPLRRASPISEDGLGLPALAAGRPEGVLVVPLVADARVVGTLTVLGKEGGFTQDDEDFLALFASSAAIALTNSILFEQTLEIDRLKSDFVAVVSHELRTPLAVVLGNLELLGDERFWTLNPQQSQFLKSATTNSHRLLLLINDILDFSKLENSSLPMTMSPNELSEVVKQAAENLTRLFEERELNLRLDLASDLPLAEMDEQRIAQVLTNLISNAIKFSPAGAPVEVTVRQENGSAVVRVRDHGEGIRREDMPRLFKKFSQLDSRSTRKVGGTGLGLAICKGIVEAHGGRIWAESEPGEGSTFAFTLPLAVDTARAA
jgi:signal transduction histidine kinase/ActR/RegA family two-component response regulator